LGRGRRWRAGGDLFGFLAGTLRAKIDPLTAAAVLRSVVNHLDAVTNCTRFPWRCNHLRLAPPAVFSARAYADDSFRDSLTKLLNTPASNEDVFDAAVFNFEGVNYRVHRRQIDLPSWKKTGLIEVHGNLRAHFRESPLGILAQKERGAAQFMWQRFSGPYEEAYAGQSAARGTAAGVAVRSRDIWRPAE